MWAFSIGTSIGWGSFIVTCNAYLSKSGILGTVFGLPVGMAVICQGQDYDRIDHLLEEVSEANEQSRASGDVLIACGMARYRNGETVEAVFERADHQMYENKNHLKA